ncbi:MAG: pyrroloquinoline quinone biosynthesis protein PqqB [Hyphomonadaceae bacterium]|jgi:pyrroloquinoline quinone biosynthesis protein B|nr:pyrroloquinoline quinone biosynthesis protein PqqB [Hyphomonadaceae bacterium]
MFIRILGSAAGGGFPQLNCNCRNCADVRAGKPGFRPRTQSSVAVSRDGQNWVLLNASPDLRQQIAATPALAPSRQSGLRTSPIKAAVVTNGDVDHVAGLLSLREGIAFTLYASQRVLATLAANSIFNVLDERLVPRVALNAGQATELTAGGIGLGLTVEAFPVPGKIALYLEDPAAGPSLGSQAGDTVGLRIADAASGAAFFYIPGCAGVDAALAARLRGARLVLFDGTLYTDAEMLAQGLSAKTGKRMGHISMSGPDGAIAAFRGLGVERRVFVHVNNTNPVLREDSPERAEVEAAGWAVAFDGMEIRL